MEVNKKEVKSSPNKKRRTPIMYNGKYYSSIAKLSRFLQIDYKKLQRLMKNGLSAEEAILTIQKKKYEYQGKYYATQQEIADDLGISLRSFQQNSRYKKIRQEILSHKKASVIFRGATYKNKEELYQTLGISGSGIRKYAIRHNITTEQALNEIADKKFNEGEQ